MIKCPSRYADSRNMSAGTLPSEAWIVIGLIAALAVGLCLAVMANVLEYELGFQKLIREARALREAVFGPEDGRGSRSSIRTIAPEPLTDTDTDTKKRKAA